MYVGSGRVNNETEEPIQFEKELLQYVTRLAQKFRQTQLSFREEIYVGSKFDDKDQTSSHGHVGSVSTLLRPQLHKLKRLRVVAPQVMVRLLHT
jgi:hypothetical protein